jgi:hypothetical protein
LARAHTDECISRLAALVRNPGKNQSKSISVQAAQILLDRGWGKPHQTVSGEDGKAIEILVRTIVDGKD